MRATADVEARSLFPCTGSRFGLTSVPRCWCSGPRTCSRALWARHRTIRSPSRLRGGRFYGARAREPVVGIPGRTSRPSRASISAPCLDTGAVCRRPRSRAGWRSTWVVTFNGGDDRLPGTVARSRDSGDSSDRVDDRWPEGDDPSSVADAWSRRVDASSHATDASSRGTDDSSRNTDDSLHGADDSSADTDGLARDIDDLARDTGDSAPDTDDRARGSDDPAACCGVFARVRGRLRSSHGWLAHCHRRPGSLRGPPCS